MDEQEVAEDVRRSSVGSMYLTVIGVGLLCSLAIVSVYELTRPIILRNRLAFRDQAVMAVLPGARSSIAFYQREDGRFMPADVDQQHANLVFAGYDPQGSLVGVAIEARGRGYQDIIDLIYGYSFETETILAMRVLQSRETPGLGDRIETDPDFQANFGELDIRLSESAETLANPIRWVKAGEKVHTWEIDGISGATITSRAVADILRDSSQFWIPRLYPRRDDFTPRATENR